MMNSDIDPSVRKAADGHLAKKNADAKSSNGPANFLWLVMPKAPLLLLGLLPLSERWGPAQC